MGLRSLHWEVNCRARWLAAFALVGAMLIGLAPSAAQAHGNHVHHAAPAPLAHEHAAPAPANAAAPARHAVSLSPSCPPGRGKNCCCGDPSVLPRAGELPALLCSARSSFAVPSAGPAKPAVFEAAAPAAPPPSHAAPRGPPALS
jgi:hypothetical protein